MSSTVYTPDIFGHRVEDSSLSSHPDTVDWGVQAWKQKKKAEGATISQITNRYDLPEPFVGFAKADPYSKGEADYSVTELIDSPRISKLKTLHDDEIEEDVSSMVMALLGTAIHSILEDGAPPECIVEERLYMTVDGKTISGGIDLQTPDLDSFILSDYKSTAAATIKFNPDGKNEWVEQLNVYAALAEANGKLVSGLEVVAIIRDWTLSRASSDPEYPQQAIVRVPIPMWPGEMRDQYIRDRVAAHIKEGLPLCTDDERWKRDTTYAVMQGNYKRAKRVCSTMAEAEEFAGNISNAHIDVRHGKNIRCENYCPASEFCEQWKEIQKLEGEMDE